MFKYAVPIYTFGFAAILLSAETTFSAGSSGALLSPPPLNLECVLSRHEVRSLDKNKKREKILLDQYKFSFSGIGQVQTALEADVGIVNSVENNSDSAKNKSTWEFKGFIQSFEKNKNLKYQINAHLVESLTGAEKPLRSIQLPILRLQIGESVKKSWPVDRKEIFDLNCTSQ